MSVVRMHRYAVDPSDFEEFRTRRTAAIAAIRAAHPALTETRLIRLEDGTYTDIWRWQSAPQMGAAFGSLPNTPEAGAAMALTQDATALNGEIVDEQ